MKTKRKCFTPGQLESLCKALADTDTGLTGSEIGQALAQVRVADFDPNNTKWRRLYNALSRRQNTDQSGDRILAFIHAALDPARYARRKDVFNTRRGAANVPLAFYGMEYTEQGKFAICTPAQTLNEAEQRADRLRSILIQRNVEPEVLKFCRAELLSDNYFHAVLEASKSIAAALRVRTGLNSDGAALVQEALGGNAPRLRINSLRSDTDLSEQRGFANLLTGIFGTFRNPTAHAPRIEWPVSEQDALDLLSLASYIHRRLKAAVVPTP